MKAPHLSARLAVAAELVGHTATLADVGCDHGKLCVYALCEGLAESAVAVDISAPSLAKAERLAAEYGVDLVTRLGNGLVPTLDDNVETAAILGMGGMEIARILALAGYCPPRLVLMPHQNADVVCRYLHLAHYTIVRDFVLEEGGHWYRVYLAHSAADACPLGNEWQSLVEALPDDANWYVGLENVANPAYRAYRKARMARLQDIVDKGNRDPKVRAELHYLYRIK